MASDQSKTLTPVDDDPILLRSWSHNDDLISIAEPEELENEAVEAANGGDRDEVLEESMAPKFKPGDHVIRWKIMKALLWPIQIHGIVLSSDVDDDGMCSIVIADFGYSSTQDGKKKKRITSYQ